MGKIILCRYTATSDHKPENLYQYAQKNGVCDPVRTYDDIMDALQELPEYETTCNKTLSGYRIVCFALEQDEM